VFLFLFLIVCFTVDIKAGNCQQMFSRMYSKNKQEIKVDD